MIRMSRRKKLIQAQVDFKKVYSVQEAVQVLKGVPPVRFNETIEVSINLGVDASKTDQTVRGAVVLPHGTGKDVKVGVFVQGEAAEIAYKAGADVVGFEDLAEKIKQGDIAFDILIATPDSMRMIGPLGQILGPKGLMPNPKLGTVTNDITTAVKNAKSGQITFRADKNGIIHARLGKLTFTADQIAANLQVLISELKRLKPISSKGIYLKKMVLSSTMGPGLVLEVSSYQ